MGEWAYGNTKGSGSLQRSLANLSHNLTSVVALSYRNDRKFAIHTIQDHIIVQEVK